MAIHGLQLCHSGTPEQKTAALEEAKKWNERRIEVDPKDAEAYYYLGVINWAQAFTPIQTARVQLSMKPARSRSDQRSKGQERVQGEIREAD